MSKVILVMDKPENCMECPFVCFNEDESENRYCAAYHDGQVACNFKEDKPEWCPLRKIPRRKSEFSAQSDYLLFSAKGWNACIDAILNEGGNNA